MFAVLFGGAHVGHEIDRDTKRDSNIERSFHSRHGQMHNSCGAFNDSWIDTGDFVADNEHDGRFGVSIVEVSVVQNIEERLRARSPLQRP